MFSPSLTEVCQYPSPSLQIKSWSSSASISTIRRSRITSNCHPTIYSPFSGSVVLSPGYRLESPKDCEDAPWWVWPVPPLARAHAWVSGWVSGGARIDVHKKLHISVSLPLFLPPFPLSKNKSMKYFFKKECKNISNAQVYLCTWIRSLTSENWASVLKKKCVFPRGLYLCIQVWEAAPEVISNRSIARTMSHVLLRGENIFHLPQSKHGREACDFEKDKQRSCLKNSVLYLTKNRVFCLLFHHPPFPQPEIVPFDNTSLFS